MWVGKEGEEGKERRRLREGGRGMEGGGDGGAGAGAPACAPACAHDHLVLAHGSPEPAQPKRPPLRDAARAGSHAARARGVLRAGTGPATSPGRARRPE